MRFEDVKVGQSFRGRGTGNTLLRVQTESDDISLDFDGDAEGVAVITRTGPKNGSGYVGKLVSLKGLTRVDPA